MPKLANDKNCDLCGLPVKVTGFKLETQEGQKIFCCLGCKAIYTLYYGKDEEPRLSISSDDSSNDLN
ncbi:MAG: heavy metal translocating P-type ATPase metal-binding domain-containing protein [Methylicorpusculum sp.]|uniref:heavy metal translocating P-type ATPase metal-binding domain-containing protein n=1 Tax=Methylicorpusculum sp. TaxID=2713644 RepID=UPI002721352C|nr:heavy metal translocating P-type ATPase metal-binding domain-containing protein [Methylicorpusculum sp.]MDO8845419.1 heavy metal translocating P-type ATPase metal-binding domain-containing protein [Methylicorpusculum sp.]MDO8938574.1 heavy metal translocating P-type ATPase metal-binding domain-containing protein [Methylicorpusculum sp.]MDO9238399.1 heavy metal translocating P-type ATPase metal-binding domain-containing protein [Methylicorpusculum sp.]MDP2204226.1 heavy metal translocating P-